MAKVICTKMLMNKPILCFIVYVNSMQHIGATPEVFLIGGGRVFGLCPLKKYLRQYSFVFFSFI